ncbi:MAG: hypothetical protein L0Y74_06110, partial [candidate division Zixibacteria bacterium]|nr:hypothetical protein [candidate division Zixibacteria bacterium]
AVTGPVNTSQMTATLPNPIQSSDDTDNEDWQLKVTALQDTLNLLQQLNQDLEKRLNSQTEGKIIKEPIFIPMDQMILRPKIIYSGDKVDLLDGELIMTVGPHPIEGAGVEAQVKKVASPLERDMGYGEIIRLFYAQTGTRDTFKYEGQVFNVWFVEVGQFGNQLGAKVAIYIQ